MKKIILIGAGGHANSIIELIENSKEYQILGFIDRIKKNISSRYKIIGDDTILEKNEITKKNTYFIVSIGLIKNFQSRLKIFNNLKKKNFKIATVIAKTSIVSKISSIGVGTVIFNNAIVNRNSRVGENSIVNTSAVIEHDVFIGNNTHISTGAIINGGAKIGSNTFIGSGTIIKEGIKVGNNCIVGMGLSIKKDIKSNLIIK